MNFDIEKKIKDLEKEWRYCKKKINEIKANLEAEGLTVESKANGLVKNPNVQMYNDLIKNKLAINKQLIDLYDKLNDTFNNDNDYDETEDLV